MKKDELSQRLEQLEKWAKQLRERAQNDSDFKKLKDGQEVPSGANVFGVIRASAQDAAFQEYALLAGPAGGAATVPMAVPAAGEEKPEPIGFAEFMRNLAESVVATQERLDQESARYLAKIKDERHIHPSVFRLPKVSAEMRFALKVERDKALNFLFFSNKEKNTSQNEQGIQFDIVSVPAPPDALRAMAALAPRFDLVLDPFARRPVVDLIGAAAPSQLLAPLIDGARNTPDRLMIIETAPQEPREVLVFHATRDSDNSVGLWKLQLAPGAQPIAIYRFAKNNGPEEKEVRDFVLALSDRQERFLR